MTKNTNTCNNNLTENINKNLVDKNLRYVWTSQFCIYLHKNLKRRNCCHLGPLVNLLKMINDSIGVESTRFRENYVQ